MRSNSTLVLLGLAALACQSGLAQDAVQALNTKFKPAKAPQTQHLLLKKDDRLAICGDSITEQKMYSRIIEDYLTMCVPDLNVTVRQYGWSGERAPGFLGRMTNDCLRFKPTIATTCYGMNDHEYRRYEERIGNTYRSNSAAIIDAFRANGVRVIQGSPGCVGNVPGWVKSGNGTVDDLNANLCKLRNLGIDLAREKHVGFADVFWPMLVAGVNGQKQYGDAYAIAGKDGVHPGWAGQTVMAYAFLKAMGLNGDLGSFTIDLKKNKMTASPGHEVLSAKDGEFHIQSSRYVFCPCVDRDRASASYPACDKDEVSADNSIRSALTLIPFQQELNRLMLVAKVRRSGNYKVTWGSQSKRFTAAELARGVNLAAEFSSTPFAEQFAKVDAAVAAKQAYETKEIKELFRSPAAKADMEKVAARAEQEREPLAAAIKSAFIPVTHRLKIQEAGD